MEAFVSGFDAALDVTEVFLQRTDLDGELVAEIVERPLLLSESLNDLLSAGPRHGVVTPTGDSGPPDSSHSRTVMPSTNRSSTTAAPARTRTVTHAGR